MNISLTPELEKIVQDKVKSGFYGNASEVLRAGLRLLVEQEQGRQGRFEQLVQDIEIGVEQAKKGEVVSGPAAFAKLEKRHASRKK
jgi:antitoxin ParD1/3/4